MFHQYTSTKLDNKVLFPIENLDVSEFLCHEAALEGGNHVYDLQSAVCHFGGMLFSYSHIICNKKKIIWLKTVCKWKLANVTIQQCYTDLLSFYLLYTVECLAYLEFFETEPSLFKSLKLCNFLSDRYKFGIKMSSFCPLHLICFEFALYKVYVVKLGKYSGTFFLPNVCTVSLKGITFKCYRRRVDLNS